MSIEKKIHKIYAVWDYELEVDELDEQSKQGWQLVHGGLFSRRYEKDESVCYRYQLDYNVDTDSFYMEMFRDQGWEYVNSTANGWNYFQKKVQDEVSEDDYIIYTDEDSKKVMNRRFLKMMILIFSAVFLANLNSLFRFIEAPKIATSGILFIYLIYGLFLVKAVVGLKKSAKGIKPKRRTPIEIYFVLLILGMVFFIQGLSTEFSMRYGMVGNESENRQQFTYEVELPDVYYISMSTDSSDIENIALELEIRNEEGEMIYQNGTFGRDEKRVAIFLRRGTYQCIIDGDMKEGYQINIR